MIRLIASDLDGTLLNGEHSLDERTAEAIRSVQAAGIEFVANTGRGPVETEYVLAPRKIKCARILNNGALGLRSDGTTFAAHCMEPEIFSGIVREAAAENECVFFFTTKKDLIVGTWEQIESFIFAQMHLFHEHGTPEEMRQKEIYKTLIDSVEKKTVEECERSPVTNALKAFMYVENMEKRDRLDSRICSIPHVASASSAPQSIEVTREKAQKGLTLFSYIKERGIAPSEVLVMGDSMNDLSMMSGPFKVRVAMENSIESLKTYATHIAPDHREYGAARIMEALLDNSLDSYICGRS